MEAAQDALEPYVELRVDTPRGTNLFLSITNSCGVPPQSDGAGGYLTHKPDKEKHGMGSKSVRVAVDKYGGTFNQSYEAGTGLFHTTVVVNKDIID